MTHLWTYEPTVVSYDNYEVLTGRIPIRVLTFVEWDLHFIVLPSYILRRPGESFRRDNIDLSHFLHKRIRRVSHEFPVPYYSALNTWDGDLTKSPSMVQTMPM